LWEEAGISDVEMENIAIILLRVQKATGIIYLRGILSSSHWPPGLLMIFTFASCAMFLKVEDV